MANWLFKTELDDPKMAVVDVEPVRAWTRPVKLAEVKADPAFADFALVRFSRLSVMPVETKLFKRLERMGR